MPKHGIRIYGRIKPTKRACDDWELQRAEDDLLPSEGDAKVGGTWKLFDRCAKRLPAGSSLPSAFAGLCSSLQPDHPVGCCAAARVPEGVPTLAPSPPPPPLRSCFLNPLLGWPWLPASRTA